MFYATAIVDNLCITFRPYKDLPAGAWSILDMKQGRLYVRSYNHIKD